MWGREQKDGVEGGKEARMKGELKERERERERSRGRGGTKTWKWMRREGRREGREENYKLNSTASASLFG